MKVSCGWCNKEFILYESEYKIRMKNNKRGKLYCSISCGLRKEIQNEKKCPSCNEIKPSLDFYNNKKRYDGLTVYCKICTNDKSKKRAEENPELQSQNHKKRRWRKKIQLFNILGQNSCKFCGFSVWQALQFEHKNGNGAKDKIRFKNVDSFYKFYIENEDEAKNELQICCANCNWIKRFRNNEQLKK